MKRNLSLDFLRFVGVFLTMFTHLKIQGTTGIETFFGLIKKGGWAGVDLFFVLSGFLVSGLIFKELKAYGAFHPGQFLIRRGFKIYPAFYLFLAVAWIVDAYTHAPSHNWQYIQEAVFISNYCPGIPLHGWLWSICVEEHFYLLLSVGLFLLMRWDKLDFRAIKIIYIFFLVVGLGGRLYTLQHPEFEFFRDVTKSHLRFDSLFFGVVVSYMFNNTKYSKKMTVPFSWWIFCIAVAGAGLCFIDLPRPFFLILLSVTPWCFGYIMLMLLPVNKGWMVPLAWVGKYSYSIYLFHGLVNMIATRYFTGWVYYAAYLLGSLAVGIFVSASLEYPMLALRDKWFPKGKIIPLPTALVKPIKTN